MFENSKTDTEKRISSLSDEILDIKNQKKLSELDFEKRVLLLEDAINTINKTVGSAKNLKDMKENLEHVIDVQSKIREVEDREIIDRLESMQAKDTLNLLGLFGIIVAAEVLIGALIALSGSILAVSRVHRNK